MTDLLKNGELRLPIGVAGFTLFNTLRIETDNVRLYLFGVTTPPKTLARPDRLELSLIPPLRIASPPRISSPPVLPPPGLASPKVQVRLMSRGKQYDARPFQVVTRYDHCVRQRPWFGIECADSWNIHDTRASEILGESRAVVIRVSIVVGVHTRRNIVRASGLHKKEWSQPYSKGQTCVGADESAMTVIVKRPAVLAAEVVGIAGECTRPVGITHRAAVDVISEGAEIAIDSSSDRNNDLVLPEHTASFVLVDVARGATVRPWSNGPAQTIECGRQRSIDVSSQELVQAASVRVVQCQRNVVRQLAFDTGSRLDDVGNLESRVDLIDGPRLGAALLRTQLRERSRIRNIGKEQRIADDELRLIDTVELSGVQKQIRREPVVEDSASGAQYGLGSLSLAVPRRPRQSDTGSKVGAVWNTILRFIAQASTE